MKLPIICYTMEEAEDLATVLHNLIVAPSATLYKGLRFEADRDSHAQDCFTVHLRGSWKGDVTHIVLPAIHGYTAARSRFHSHPGVRPTRL